MINGKLKVDLRPLEQLEKALGKKIFKKALTTASRIVRSAVKAGAQLLGTSGDLAKSIGVKVVQKPDGAQAIVGPRSNWFKQRGTITRGKNKGKPRISRPSKIANILEKGSKHQQKKPFIQPAIDSTNSQFIDLLNSTLQSLIESELKSI